MADELLRGQGPELGPFATRYALPERTMLHVLRDQAQERPEETWTVFDEGRLTFRGARERAHQVAHGLLDELGEGVHVGLFLRNQVEFVPVLYGALAAGGVAVPLNADAKGILLQGVVERARLAAIVVRGDLLDVLAALRGLGETRLVLVADPVPDELPASLHGARVARLDEWLDGRPTTQPRELPDSSETAVIQFTSGTTGHAKGVVCPHHFFFLYSALEADGLGHGPDDVLTTPLPLFHVAALHEVTNAALHAGATAVLKPRFSASAYWDEIARDGATFGILLGPLAAILMRTPGDPPPHALRRLFCLPFPPDGEAFERRFGVTLLWQAYGMTEIKPNVMRSEMVPDVPYDTVGHVHSIFDYGVVDERDRVLGPGEVGELVYRPRLPDAMARGYYEDPAATATAFRNCRFHTGDAGFVDEAGLVHFQGRMQDRIRRRGENVSAAELEYVAMSHEAIVEAAAYAVPDELGEHEVKLDVVTVTELDLDAYHAWLCDELPRYMVPRYLERLPELPKSASAKVQKHLLAEASLDRPAVRSFRPPPRSSPTAGPGAAASSAPARSTP